MYVLQSLQRQFSGFHSLTLFLTVFKLSISLQSSGSMSHTFGSKNETLLLPWYTDFASDFENLEIFLRLDQLLSFCVKYHS